KAANRPFRQYRPSLTDLTIRLPMSVPAVAPPCADSLKASYKTAKAALLERLQSATNDDGLMHALGRATDDALKGAWEACEMPASAALLAVGGYGRGELAPY